MQFGVPKETRDLEKRVALTPAGVQALVRAGHTVYVQSDAGAGAGFTNEHYRDVGATIVYSAAEAYGRAEVVVKVARPTAQEHRWFTNGQTLMSFLHLAVASPDLHAALAIQEITAIALEEIQEEDGSLPLLTPMSEIAGRLAPVIAGQLLMSNHGGRGILLSGLPGVPRGIVGILGGGTLGGCAARAFVAMGAQVIILDKDVNRLRRLDAYFGGTVTTMISNDYNINRVVGFADVLVGSVLVPGQRTPILVTREMVRKMRPGAVILDYAIDQGGCVETSRPTTLRDPTFVAEGVTHFCVPNTASMVARTASHALTNALLPYLLMIGQLGVQEALAASYALRKGTKLFQGKIASHRLAAALGREVEVDLTEALNLA
ncbi:MAG: alanine dehydrogenase [Caldilineales bacterium]|nr:alanine dehydrogenase [Caldilineales bacterium]